VKFLTNQNLASLSDSHPAAKYISERGLAKDYLCKAGCGVLTADKSGELLKLLKEQELVEEAKALGIISPLGLPFQDAIYFPMYDTEGNVANFSIRHLPWSSLIASGGSPHWTTRLPIRRLIGQEYPERESTENFVDAIFLCEGATDTISLLQRGFNSYGLVGVNRWHPSFTDEIKKFSKVIIAFDRDENKSGQNAALKLCKKLVPEGISPLILKLPMGYDINQFLQEHPEGFGDYVRNNCIFFKGTKYYRQWEVKEKKKTSEYKNGDLTKKIAYARDVDAINLFRRLFPDMDLSSTPKGFKCICPFHDDTKSSFHIYTGTNSFYCFGCGFGGDTIELVRKTKNLEFKETVEGLSIYYHKENR